VVAVLGRYRVLKHLTSGGMADVLLGRADGIEGFERHVVLKRIRAEHARDRRFIQMFVDEARLAAGLHHQSIVQVFDIGEDNGEYFFAMEYLHGEDLRRVLAAAAKARTHVPLQIVCAIVSATASALHYAHERRDSKGKPLNVVHRDVSPSNVLIGYDGAVKVVDFGIAKATLRQSETVAGSLKGKISYMSPEQTRGGTVDRRSDVYGLGVLLYELATTSRLFKGDNDYAVMDAIVNGRVTLPQVRRPDLPNELSSIMMRALATDPTRRYQTADELRAELDDFAARNFGAVTTATIATYMKKMFGVRPEPWVDLSAPERPSASTWDAAAESRDSRRSFPPARPSAADLARNTHNETAPTQRFGWEAAQRMRAAHGSKLPWLGGALLLLGGLAVWKLALDKDAPESANVAAATTPAPAVTVPTADPAPAPAPAPDPAPAPAPQVAAVVEPAAAPVVVAPPVEEPARPARKVERKQDKAPAPAPAAPVVAKAAAPTPPPAAVTTPVPAPAAPPPAAPAPAPAPVKVAEAPAALPAVAPPPPKEIETAMPTLSNATVSSVASDHGGQLAKCEGGATLKGDVTVSFQIDGSGKVVKSQLSSTIKNMKAAACILKAVQSWKFPKPPSGAAKGVYTISYQ
jgi:serine/threonine protein kinase